MAATSATDVNQTRAKARDKSATRIAILDAARRVATRSGSDKLTLAEVATEAAMARGTVYGYFRSREELLQSVLADDLTKVAQAMSGMEFPAEAPEAPPAQTQASAQIIAMPAPVVPAAEPAAESKPATSAAAEGESEDFFKELGAVQGETRNEPAIAAAVETQPDVEEVIEPAELPAVAEPNHYAEQKAQLDHILSKLAPNDPENSEGSAAAMSRFDRRLRVVERTLLELQGHQERSEQTSSTSVGSISENLRGLNQRLEEAERRQREAVADLRADSREAARRLDALEARRLAAMPEPESMVTPAVAKAADLAKTEIAEPANSEPLPEPAHSEPAEEAVPPNEGESPVEPGAAEANKPEETQAAETSDSKVSVTYLAAARRSAQAAVMSARTSERKPKSWLFRIPKKYLMFTCGLMSVVVVIVGVLVVQRMSAIAAHADTMPAGFAKRVAMHTFGTKRMAAATPLDMLSALASGGNAKAQLIVGLKYLKGSDSVAKNPIAAAQWIAKAARHGEPMAQYWAGYVYQHGLGVSVDPDEALRWYEASADQGNTKAMYNLGVGFAQGWTGAKDTPEAARWFARAARLGFVDAQFNLAVLYERGEGLPPSLTDAYKWYSVAAANGDAESKKRLDAIATQLDADDLAAAQRSAMMFTPTPVVQQANTMPALDLKRT